MEELRKQIKADLETIKKTKARGDLVTRLFAVFLGASLLFNGLFLWGYYSQITEPVVVYKQEILPVVTTSLKKGERLGYTVDFCKTREVPGTVVRTLIYEDGSQIVDEASSTTAQSTGCRVITVYSYEVPLNANCGKARVLVTTQYDTGGLEPQVYRKFTEWFEIDC